MQTPCNKNATPNAKRLLNYLSETAGKGIITGQHTQTVPMEELSYIREHTGRTPKLTGFELLSYSPNINYEDASKECLTEVYENRGTLDTAYELASDREKSVILTFTFHWFSPIGGRDKSFYAKNTDFDASKVLIKDSPERDAFFHDMEALAEHLKRFNEADIPILWRPFHEAEGDWFWWGAKGAGIAGGLYKLMYEYFTEEKGLNNLLWVWNCPVGEAYPGDEYVDVISRDVYLKEYKATDYREEYEELIAATSDSKVAALAEVGYLPDVALLEKTHILWAYFMTWSKEFIIGEQYNSVESLKRVYESRYAITI